MSFDERSVTVDKPSKRADELKEADRRISMSAHCWRWCVPR